MSTLSKVILFVTLFFGAAGLKAQDRLIINGSIDKRFENQTLVLERVYTFRSALPRYKSEYKVKDGRFFFSLPARGLEQYTIRIKHDAVSSRFASLLLLPKHTKIAFLDTLLKKYRVVGNDIDSVEKTSLNAITDRSTYTQFEVNKLVTDWIDKHPESQLNPYLLYNVLLNKASDDEILRLFNLVPESNKKGTYYDELKYTTDSLFIGKILPDFIQSDTSGTKIKLSEFRGKYVLVDFWASWCVPCRAENPNLLTAMKTYDHKSFEIISVSLDDKSEPWLEAIRKDGIEMWKHISDLKGWDNKVSRKYRISSVPSNFLLDPSGKIIAKNVRGQEVLSVLERFIQKQ